jgi:hypothetical protein
MMSQPFGTPFEELQIVTQIERTLQDFRMDRLTLAEATEKLARCLQHEMDRQRREVY